MQHLYEFIASFLKNFKHVQRMIAINNTAATCRAYRDNFTKQLLHSCVSFLSSGETYLFFSFWLINFASHDDAWIASRSWIISHILLHRRSSWRTVTKETRRLSAVKNIIGDLSIAGERILITFCPSPTSRKLNIFPTRSLRTVVTLELRSLAFICIHISTQNRFLSRTNIYCRIFVSSFYFRKLQYS